MKSFRPLNIFLYQKGLCRFTTQKYMLFLFCSGYFEMFDRYSLSDLDNLFVHLTNSSINKYSPTLHHNKDIIGRGSKWTLNRYVMLLHVIGNNVFRLFQYLQGEKVDILKLWRRYLLLFTVVI